MFLAVFPCVDHSGTITPHLPTGLEGWLHCSWWRDQLKVLSAGKYSKEFCGRLFTESGKDQHPEYSFNTKFNGTRSRTTGENYFLEVQRQAERIKL